MTYLLTLWSDIVTYVIYHSSASFDYLEVEVLQVFQSFVDTRCGALEDPDNGKNLR